MTGVSLTHEQKRLLDFLKARLAASDGIAPTFREMQLHMGAASTSCISRLILALEERGKIRRLRDRRRTITVLETSSDPFDVAREALQRVGARTTAAHVARIATALTEARNAA